MGEKKRRGEKKGKREARSRESSLAEFFRLRVFFFFSFPLGEERRAGSAEPLLHFLLIECAAEGGRKGKVLAGLSLPNVAFIVKGVLCDTTCLLSFFARGRCWSRLSGRDRAPHHLNFFPHDIALVMVGSLE